MWRPWLLLPFLALVVVALFSKTGDAQLLVAAGESSPLLTEKSPSVRDACLSSAVFGVSSSWVSQGSFGADSLLCPEEDGGPIVLRALAGESEDLRIDLTHVRGPGRRLHLISSSRTLHVITGGSGGLSGGLTSFEDFATIFPRNRTSARMLIPAGERESFHEIISIGPTEMVLTGARGFRLDMKEYEATDTAESSKDLTIHNAGGCLLFSSSATMGSIPSIRVEPSQLAHVTLLGGGHVTLGTLPQAHYGSIDIRANGRVEVVGDQVDYNGLSIRGHGVVVRGTLNGTCPVAINTPTMPASISSPCACTGTQSIVVVAESLIVDASVSTQDGDINFSTDSSTITIGVSMDIRGPLEATKAGNIFLTADGGETAIAITANIAVNLGSLEITGNTGTNGDTGVRITDCDISANASPSVGVSGGFLPSATVRTGVAMDGVGFFAKCDVATFTGVATSPGNIAVGISTESNVDIDFFSCPATFTGTVTDNPKASSVGVSLKSTNIDSDAPISIVGTISGAANDMEGIEMSQTVIMTTDDLSFNAETSGSSNCASLSATDTVTLRSGGTLSIIARNQPLTGSSNFRVRLITATVVAGTLRITANDADTCGSTCYSVYFDESSATVTNDFFVESVIQGGFSTAIFVNSNTFVSAGTLTLAGSSALTATGGNQLGVHVKDSSIVVTDSLSLTGEIPPQALPSNFCDGVHIDNSLFTVRGSNNVIYGTGGSALAAIAGIAGNDGVVLTDAQFLVEMGGSLTVTGTGGTGVDESHGVTGNVIVRAPVSSGGSLDIIGSTDGMGWTNGASHGVLLGSLDIQGSMLVTVSGTTAGTAVLSYGVFVGPVAGDTVTVVGDSGLTIIGDARTATSGEHHGVLMGEDLSVSCSDSFMIINGMAGRGGTGTFILSGIVMIGTNPGLLDITGTALPGDGSNCVGIIIDGSPISGDIITMDGSGGGGAPGSENNAGVQVVQPVDGTTVSITGRGGAMSIPGTETGNDGVKISADISTDSLTINGDCGGGTGPIGILLDPGNTLSMTSGGILIGRGVDPMVDDAVGIRFAGSIVSTGGSVTVDGRSVSTTAGGMGIHFFAVPLMNTIVLEGGGSFSGSSPSTGILYEGDWTFSSTNPGSAVVFGGRANGFNGIGIKFASLARVHAINIALTFSGVAQPTPDTSGLHGVDLFRGSILTSDGAGSLSIDGIAGTSACTSCAGVRIGETSFVGTLGSLIITGAVNYLDGGTGVAVEGNVTALVSSNIQGTANSASAIARDGLGCLVANGVKLDGDLTFDCALNGPGDSSISAAFAMDGTISLAAGTSLTATGDASAATAEQSHGVVLSRNPTSIKALGIGNSISLVGNSSSGMDSHGILVGPNFTSVASSDAVPVSFEGMASNMCADNCTGVYFRLDSPIEFQLATLDIVGVSENSLGVLVCGSNIDVTGDGPVTLDGTSVSGQEGVLFDTGALVNEAGADVLIIGSGVSDFPIAVVGTWFLDFKTGGDYRFRGGLRVSTSNFVFGTGMYDIIMEDGLYITPAGQVQLSNDLSVSMQGPTIEVESGTLSVAASPTASLSLGVPSIRTSGANAVISILRPTVLGIDVTMQLDTQTTVAFAAVDGEFEFVVEASTAMNSLLFTQDIGASTPLDTITITEATAGFLTVNFGAQVAEVIVVNSQSYMATVDVQSGVPTSLFMSASDTVSFFESVTGNRLVEISAKTAQTAAVKTYTCPFLFSYIDMGEALLSGTFLGTIDVREDVTARLISMTSLGAVIMREMSTLGIGAPGSAASATIASLQLLDSSVLEIDVGGDSSNPGDDFDQLIAAFVTIELNGPSMNVLSVGDAPNRGEDFPVLVGTPGPSSLTGEFVAPTTVENINVGGVVMRLSYPNAAAVVLTSNQLPVTMSDSFSFVTGNHFLTPGVLADDFDPDGDPLTAFLFMDDGDADTDITLSPNGTLNVTFPNAGVFSIQYVAIDSKGEESTPTNVSFSVDPAPSISPSPSPSASPTGTASSTSPPSGSSTASLSVTPSQTLSATPTRTMSSTSSPTSTGTGSSSRTGTSSPSVTATETPSPSTTLSAGSSPSQTATTTKTASETSSNTPSTTKSATKTRTPSISPSSTATMTGTPSTTISTSQTSAPSQVPSQTSTKSISGTPTSTHTAAGTSAVTPSPTASLTVTPSPSTTSTASASSTTSSTASLSQTPSSTTSASRTPSSTESAAATETATITPSRTSSPTASSTSSTSQSSTQTPSKSGTGTPTVSFSHTRTTSRTKVNAQVPSSSNSQSPSKSQTFLRSFSAFAFPPSELPSTGLLQPPAPTAPPALSPSKTTTVTRSMIPQPTNPPCLLNCIDFTAISVPVEEDLGVDIFEAGNSVGEISIDAQDEEGLTLIVQRGSTEAIGTSRDDRQSVVVDLTLISGDGTTVQPTSDVEICLDVDDKSETADHGCLAFFDEEESQWVCEDLCLDIDDDGRACGSTDHFTNFAILLSGGSGGAGGQCSSASEDYILDAAWQDLTLVASFCGAAIVCCVLVALVALCLPGVFDRVHGKEYARIRTLRSHDTATKDSTSNP